MKKDRTDEKIISISFISIIIVLIFFSNIVFGLRYSTGTSMLPMLGKKNIMYVQYNFYENNLTNKIVIISYQLKNYTVVDVCHICLIDNGTYILTKGINNPINDGWTNKNKVYGVIVAWIILES